MGLGKVLKFLKGASKKLGNKNMPVFSAVDCHTLGGSIQICVCIVPFKSGN